MPDISKHQLGVPASTYILDSATKQKYSKRPWKLRVPDDKKFRKNKKPRKKTPGLFYPLIHLERDYYKDWHFQRTFNAEDEVSSKIFITNNGLRISDLVVVEICEADMNLYGGSYNEPYPVIYYSPGVEDSITWDTMGGPATPGLIVARGFIKLLHPGETKSVELIWKPVVHRPDLNYVRLVVSVYDPMLDPRYPLNYPPALFPDFHRKHDSTYIQVTPGSG